MDIPFPTPLMSTEVLINNSFGSPKNIELLEKATDLSLTERLKQILTLSIGKLTSDSRGSQSTGFIFKLCGSEKSPEFEATMDAEQVPKGYPFKVALGITTAYSFCCWESEKIFVDDDLSNSLRQSASFEYSELLEIPFVSAD